MIGARHLLKRFKGKKKWITAVDNLSLNVKKGTTYGLIGPTGSGKTTTIKIFSTLITPDEGEAVIDGHDVVKEEDIVKEKIGVLAGEFVRRLYWRLTGKQNLEFFAKLRGIWNSEERIEELLQMFDLKKRQNDLVMYYSTGMKHKLAFAIALLNDPPILLLDEPLTGIDPLTAYQIKDKIKRQYDKKTIIWASHNLYEVEEMCDTIGLLKNGRLALEGNPDILKKKYWDHEKIIVSTDEPRPFLEINNSDLCKEGLEIKTKDVTTTTQEIIRICEKHKVRIQEIKTVKPSLEDIFIAGVKNAR